MSLDHFVKLARRGVPNTGASTGEVQARRLALAILQNAIGLDDSAIEGAAEFLLKGTLNPSAARIAIGIDRPAEAVPQ